MSETPARAPSPSRQAQRIEALREASRSLERELHTPGTDEADQRKALIRALVEIDTLISETLGGAEPIALTRAREGTLGALLADPDPESNPTGSDQR